ncbi:hypothetical protein COU57_06645 [Candidatus Pacearchaeota archaeon CG10_big_fil_rev_8_21_14_0_10_32_14]|nr:MAG: hypothetical protein COU57_06645 [Candidatus Pacearchaeota archaeon CG10_big_fil_rev_8_21_14_0_10_32_14]
MELIIDNNVIFSLMKLDSTNSFVFSFLNGEFIAPSFILKEFEKHKNECFIKSKLSRKEFDQRKKEVLSKIQIIELKEYKNFFKRAVDISPDKDDVPYFALALKINCPIWSNDKQLKEQSVVKVLSTEDIIMSLFG